MLQFNRAMWRRLCCRAYHTTHAYPESMIKSTTILAIRDAQSVVIMADGQVTQGDQIIKNNVKKLRVLADGKVICGIAGATADCLTLLDILENNLEVYHGQLLRASVEMAKAWRTKREYGNLNASMVVADAHDLLIINGLGDVLQPQEGIASVGSGSVYAKSAAIALIQNNSAGLSAEEICKKAMKIAADLCIYTNDQFIMEKLELTTTEKS